MAQKTLILIHGRSWKPPAAPLFAQWRGALSRALERDHGAAAVARLGACQLRWSYYGDHSNRFLYDHTPMADRPPLPNPADPLSYDDSVSRQVTLDALATWRASDFRRDVYRGLPGYSPAGEALAETVAPILSLLHLEEPIINAMVPDLKHYWDGRHFASDARWPFTQHLVAALEAGDDVMVVSHSLGTVIAWDTFWKLGHLAEYRHRPELQGKKVSRWLTLGSPLGDPTVRRNLSGSRYEGTERYPTCVHRWVNFAAEDDYVCHDGKLRNDFREMWKKYALCDPVEDVRIFNLAVRDGRSNPHHEVGYLMHPKVVAEVAGWLGAPAVGP
jgi:hypothetical protein